MSRTGAVVAALLIACIVLFIVLGPRVPVDTTVTFDPSAIGDDPKSYLARREAPFSDIREGLQREIIWVDPGSKARTPLSIVYVHGFSASKGEIRPVPDLVAQALGANLFYTRLAGHGRTGAAMAEATVNAWINDFAEAMAIGRAIGEEVVVIATSTGGGITVWAAANQPALMEKVKALVLVSPNFGVRARGAWLLTKPWGGVLADWQTGGERGFEPRNELQARYWTTRYPTRATLPMAAITELAAASPVEGVKVPALFLISDGDRTVRPEVTRRLAAHWGAPAEIFEVTNADDPGQHVIAGDAFSPSATEGAARAIVDWVSALPR